MITMHSKTVQVTSLPMWADTPTAWSLYATGLALRHDIAFFPKQLENILCDLDSKLSSL